MTATAPPFAFVDAPLDRADALRDDPEALRRLWDAGRIVLVDADGRALVDANRALHAPGPEALAATPDAADAFGRAVFLGLRAGQGWFAASAASLPPTLPRLDLRSAARDWPAFDSTVFAQARAVLHWRARHHHCPACGGVLHYARAGWLGRCTQCALEHYPRTDPAVIVAVSDGQRLLLARQAGWPAQRYSVLAGFVEPGESLEQTVAREVLEESGVRVLDARYLASQPWPFPGSLMLGFIARAEPDEPRPSEEHEDVRWFDHATVGAALRDDAGRGGLQLSPALSISRWLVDQWHRQAGAPPA